MVAARFQGHTVLTDQPPEGGGAGAAPAPFDLFLASIATCMAYYALAFCRARGLDSEGMSLELDTERNRETHRNEKIRVALRLPECFPGQVRQGGRQGHGPMCSQATSSRPSGIRGTRRDRKAESGLRLQRYLCN